jgi:integrase
MKIRTRKLRTGKTAYLLDAYIDGRRVRVHLDATTAKEAEREGRRKWCELEDNRQLVEARRAAPYTVRRALESYRDRPGVIAVTREYESWRYAHLLPALGDIKLASLVDRDVDTYREARLKTAAPRTVNMEIGILAAAIKYAHRNDRVPMPDVLFKRAPQSQGKSHVLTPEETAKLRAASVGEGIEAEVTIISNLALRRSEFYRLRNRDFDLAQKIVMIETRKHGGRGEIIRQPMPINSAVVEIIERLRREGKLPREDSPLFGRTYKAFRGRLKKAARVAGISWADDITPHDLRHGAATHLLNSRVSPQDTAAMLRHRNPRTVLSMYAHAIPANVRSAAEMLSGAQPAKPKPGTRKRGSLKGKE